ncbi:hypothetical protein Tco_0513552 [Tanacetum coccineum]
MHGKWVSKGIPSIQCSKSQERYKKDHNGYDHPLGEILAPPIVVFTALSHFEGCYSSGIRARVVVKLVFYKIGLQNFLEKTFTSPSPFCHGRNRCHPIEYLIYPMDERIRCYAFFAPFAPFPGYAGNPNNNNGWLAADDYLLGELEAMVDEQMVVPAVDEITEQMDVHAVEEVAEPVVEAEEEQVITPVVDVVEGQMDALTMDMEEDLVVLFGDDDFEDDASNGFGEEEVWEVNKDWLMDPTTPPPVLAVPPPSVYEVGGPSTAVAEGPSFPQVGPGLLGSDAEIAYGVTIGEIVLRVLVVEGKIQVMASQMDFSYGLELSRFRLAVDVPAYVRETRDQSLQTIVTRDELQVE